MRQRVTTPNRTKRIRKTEKMNLIEKAFLIWLLIANIAAFALMGIDKSKARRHVWRISEKTLFMSAAVGGSIGAIAGMYFFRHKTKHWYFVIGMPAILVAQAAVILAYLLS